MRRSDGRRVISFIPLHAEQQAIYDTFPPKGNVYRAVLRCGRRFGKSTMLEVAAANWARNGEVVGWFSPTYKLLSPSYRRILNIIQPVVARSSKIDGLIETITCGQVEFWTLNDENAGRSRAYDRVVVDEASLIERGMKDIWEQSIAPTLLDRRGKAVMAGTPKGIDPENFFYEICTNKKLGWHEFHRPTRLNPRLDPVDVANLEHEYPPLVYQQEYLAQFVNWSGTAFFDKDRLLVDGKGVPYPEYCDAVFAVIDTAVKGGKQYDGTAVTYWAENKGSPYPLICLDYDIVSIDGALLEHWIPGVFARLDALKRECRARLGPSNVYIEDAASGSILLQQCATRGYPTWPVPSGLTSAGKDGRALNASGPVWQGLVKFSDYAYNKNEVMFKQQTRNHLVTQIVQFRIGDKDSASRADDLLDTFCNAIAISLGDADGIIAAAG